MIYDLKLNTLQSYIVHRIEIGNVRLRDVIPEHQEFINFSSTTTWFRTLSALDDTLDILNSTIHSYLDIIENDLRV